ncbi:uncharacterized protein LOC131299648 [Rhododendron vialii]|uniref:uncharacterized protein LOC131299648 n=1 Tax=Rhododendron vialii TaxID=182163 RepID=UPI00265F94EA|nr:uncharacterized protein LOC131299648 [Rhododendron vialii]
MVHMVAENVCKFVLNRSSPFVALISGSQNQTLLTDFSIRSYDAIDTLAMTKPEITGKELVPVANAQPLAMIDHQKQMRQKKSPRKRTVDPTVINIEDSEEKSKVVKSASPTPRKKVDGKKSKGLVVDDETPTVQKSPTPTKKVMPTRIKFTDHGKKPETENVYERKRKRAKREDEGVINLQSLTKRVTRSSEAVHKLKRGKDEEEDEWDEEERDEEEKGKGKKGHKSEGFKGKRKQEKVEPGMSNNPRNVKRHIQYRSTLNTVVKLIRSIPTGEFTPLQIQEINKTPFAKILLGIVEAKMDEAYVRKSDTDVLKLVKQYEGTSGRFKLGGKSVKITAKEVTLIFGIQSGPKRIVLNPTPRVPKSDFADRLCPGPKGQRILTIPLLREFFTKAVKGTTLQDANDLARVLCLLLIGTLFFANTQARVSWGYLEFVEYLDNSTSYDWATFITEDVIQELNKRASLKPTKVGGCVMGLMYWLCEHVSLINQGDPQIIPRFIKWRIGDLTNALRTNNLDSLDPQLVLSSELEPSDAEEELYRFSLVPDVKTDVKAAKLKTAVDKSGDEVVEDTSDEETESEQDEVVDLLGIIRTLTENNAEKDHIISELRRENKEKSDTIVELRRRITKHTQTTTPGLGFEGISAQFDKDHLEHENVTLHTEIGGMLIEKDIVEEKLEVAGDIIDDFVTHAVTQTYKPVEDVGEKETKSKEQEIENVEEEEEEEGGIEFVQDEGGPEYIMLPDAEVDSTTVEAYTSILECDTPKGKRGKTKVKVKSSSLTRGVKKKFTRVEKRLDDYVYSDLQKGAKNKLKQKWNPSAAPLIHLLSNTDAKLLQQIVDCSDADLTCTVWTNDVTREVVPLEDILKLLQGGDVSNWMIDGLTRMLTIQLDNDKYNHSNVAYFPCTIWTILNTPKSDMRAVLLDNKLERVFENVRKNGTKYYRYLKKYVENYMKEMHAEMKNQSAGTEILFEEQNFDAPIFSPQHAPQQESTSVDCGVIVCILMEVLAHLEPIPKTLTKTEIDKYRAGLVSRFLNDEGKSWTIKKWEARRMGKESQ